MNTIDVSDMRGKHLNRPHKLANNVYDFALKHLHEIPHKKSHYTNSSRLYFENSDLSIKNIFLSFQTYYFEETKQNLKMKYCTYHKWYRENSPFSIKQPRTDTCDFCNDCEKKLQKNNDDLCKNEYTRHKADVKVYQTIKNEILKLCKTNESNDNHSILVVEFDYAQNLPLPKLNVTSQFYKRLI